MLVQIGDLTGPFGLSFVIVWVSAGIALALGKPRRLLPLAAAAAALAAVCLYGVWRMPVSRGRDRCRARRARRARAGQRRHSREGQRRVLRHQPRPLPRAVARRWSRSRRADLARVGRAVVGAGQRRAARPASTTRSPTSTSFLIFGGLAYSEDRRRADEVQQRLPDRRRRTRARPLRQARPASVRRVPPGRVALPVALRSEPADRRLHSRRPRSRRSTFPGASASRRSSVTRTFPSGIARADDARRRRGAADHLQRRLVRPARSRRISTRRWRSGARSRTAATSCASATPASPASSIRSAASSTVSASSPRRRCVAEIRPLRIETFYTRWGDAFAWTVVIATALLLAGSFRRRRFAKPFAP